MKTDQASTSFDYYLRLHEAALLATVLEHIESGLDIDLESQAPPAAAEASSDALSMRGFTEWASSTSPAVSVGWDWITTQPGLLLLDGSSLRTNVMLVDGQGTDRGHKATVLNLVRLVEGFDWQSAVLGALRAP